MTYSDITPVAIVNKHVSADMEPRGWGGASRRCGTSDSGGRLPISVPCEAVHSNAALESSERCRVALIRAGRSALA